MITQRLPTAATAVAHPNASRLEYASAHPYRSHRKTRTASAKRGHASLRLFSTIHPLPQNSLPRANPYRRDRHHWETGPEKFPGSIEGATVPGPPTGQTRYAAGACSLPSETVPPRNPPDESPAASTSLDRVNHSQYRAITVHGLRPPNHAGNSHRDGQSRPL